MFKLQRQEPRLFTFQSTTQHPEPQSLDWELARLEELLFQHQNGNESPELEQQIQQQFALIQTLRKL